MNWRDEQLTLGAEKALFRALKTKHDTPKYGLIYHASLVGQAAPKLKGKISRVLAAKTALSIRMDGMFIVLHFASLAFDALCLHSAWRC